MKTLKEHNFFGFDATVVADSKNPFGDRITTMVVTFPRIVLAEFNTHRMFSRNSASSRAIPFAKMVERVNAYPFIPVAWQLDHKGMQGSDYQTQDWVINANVSTWLTARDQAIDAAKAMNESGNVTKQLCNRLLEPFLWHTVIVTATEWENFFALRCPQYTFQQEPKATLRSRKDYAQYFFEQFGTYPIGNGIKGEIDLIEWLKINKSHADIHISLAAEAMWDTYNESVPKELQAGEWHLPFEEEMDSYAIENYSKGYGIDGFNIRKAISIATCARISFGNINPSEVPVSKNYEMYLDLKEKRHASPFEHANEAMGGFTKYEYFKGEGIRFDIQDDGLDFYLDDYDPGFGWCDNFKGFISERHKLGI